MAAGTKAGEKPHASELEFPDATTTTRSHPHRHRAPCLHRSWPVLQPRSCDQPRCPRNACHVHPHLPRKKGRRSCTPPPCRS